jgi:TPR repeat protein
MNRSLKVIFIATTLVLVSCSKQIIKSGVNDNAESEIRLMHGYCYKNIYGNLVTNVNLDIAYKWCAMSAQRGYPKSLTLLAEMHFLGLHVEQNYQRAYELYLMAANKNNAHAQWMLHYIHLNGLGQKVSELEAKQWLLKAASNGHEKAKQEASQYAQVE